MAAYASSVTIYTPNAERISRNLGMICGEIDITNYNSTTTEETDITKYFIDSGVTGLEKGILSCDVTSSENGYNLIFLPDTGKFKAFYNVSQAITNISVADPATTVASAAAIAVSTIASVDAAHSAYMALYDSAVKVAVDAAVSGAIVNIESAVGALTTTAAQASEVANDTDLGTFRFSAVGLIKN